MSGAVERVMSELFTVLSGTQSFNVVLRSDSETQSSSASPLLRLIQGKEQVQIATLTSSGGTCECTLDFEIIIQALEASSSQNIETTLN